MLQILNVLPMNVFHRLVLKSTTPFTFLLLPFDSSLLVDYLETLDGSVLCEKTEWSAPVHSKFRNLWKSMWLQNKVNTRVSLNLRPELLR